MFRRETFDRVGLFDEALVRNQDDDLNYRVTSAGGKIFISPRARCIYYVRESPSQLFWQYCQYGYWRVAVLREHRIPTSLRQIVPVTFLLLMAIFLILGMQLPGIWRLTALALPVCFMAVLAGAALNVMIRRDLRTGLIFPLCAAIMHFAYASGFLWGAFNIGNR